MPGRLVCFVCGNPGAETTIHIKQRDSGPYFPFLEHHEPPKGSRLPTSDGVIDSCRVCYAFLSQQWETYERTKTPAVKRLYWLKRADNGHFTGAEMRLQGEYIAQVMGLQYQPGSFEEGGLVEDNLYSQEREYSGRPKHHSELRVPHYNTSHSQAASGKLHESDPSTQPRVQSSRPMDGALDLSVTKGNADSPRALMSYDDAKPYFACYICGQNQLLAHGKYIYVFANPNSDPYFPILEKIHPPRGADYISNTGQVRVCGGCKSVLYQQWQAYEMSGTPIHLRSYKISDELYAQAHKKEAKLTPKKEEKDLSLQITCYICGQTCIQDHARLLCTLPPKSPTPATMFFPFVRELKRPPGAEPIRPDGSVITCVKCFGHLSYQWQIQEVEGVSLYRREYTLAFLGKSAESVDSSKSKKPSTPLTPKSDEAIKPLNIQITASSPMPNRQSADASMPVYPTAQGLLAIAPVINTPQSEAPHTPVSQVPRSPSLGVRDVDTRMPLSEDSSASTSVGSKPHPHPSVSVPHPLQQVSAIPKKVCFLCGEKCLVTKMHNLFSYPARHEAKLVNSQMEPFFPFLANRDPAPGAESMTEDGTVGVCKICFYTLYKQWCEYESSKNPTDSNRWLRKYCVPLYICYVCSTTCERKYVRTLDTKKFHFMTEHKAPASALVLDGGEEVAVCKSCAYGLMKQYTEYERMGVPYELRKYNWMAPTSNMYDSTDEVDIQEESFEKARDLNARVTGPEGNDTEHMRQEEKGQDEGLPPGAKPPPQDMLSPASSKLQRTTATVSPLNLISTSPANGVTSVGANAALNASRTSSFAAALRKLANQAKDPPDDGSVKSASNSSSPRESTSKRGQAPPLVYSSHSVATTLTSPPVVTIAPTPSHPSMLNSDSRMPVERAQSTHSTSSLFDPAGIKSERDRPLSSMSRDDERASSRDNLSQSARRLTPHSTPGASSPMSGREESGPRGFQPYRPGEDMRYSLPTSLALDPATAAAAAAYSYPAFLPPHAFPHPAFRFDDPLLLERYRMMQPPYLPYGPTGLVPHPGMHPLLTGGRYPTELLHPSQYQYMAQQSRLSERSPSMLSERARLEEEKQKEYDREKEREREREKERELALHRERQRAAERESERARHRDRSEHRESERKDSVSSDKSRHDVSRERTGDKTEESLASRFGSIIQGTPRGMGIADRYPPAPFSGAVSLTSARSEDGKSSREESSSGHHRSSSSFKGFHKDGSNSSDRDKRYSLVNPLTESEKSRPPNLISPRSHSDHSHKSPEGSLFRPYDNKHMSNGYHGHYSSNSDTGEDTSRSSHRSHKIHSLEQKFSNNSHAERGKHDASHSRTLLSSAYASIENHMSGSHKHRSSSSGEHRRHSSHHTHQHTKDLANLSNFHDSSVAPNSYSFRPVQENEFKTEQISSESHSVVSKLDKEEKKLKEARERGSYCSDCDSYGEEEDMSDESRTQQCLLIKSGPPLELDTAPEKVTFLKQIGLTSHRRKRDREFERERKRRRRMRERSVSPIEMEEGSEELLASATLMSRIRPDELCKESDYGSKCQFFTHLLSLQAVPGAQKKVLEEIRSACENDKKRRDQQVKTSDSDTASGSSRRNSTSGEVTKCVQEQKTEFSVLRDSQRVVPTESRTSLNRLQEFAQACLSESSFSRPGDRHSLLHSKKEKQKVGKDFAQEFHNSVLQTTREKELVQRLGGHSKPTTQNDQSSNSAIQGRQVEASTSGTVTPSNSSVYTGCVYSGSSPTWPDQRLEHHVLKERSLHLRRENRELNVTAEKLSQKMEEMLKCKNQMEEERLKNQSRIDNLKKCLKKLR